jgi:hypothetical protein
MIEFNKLADGTWKRSGEASPSEEPVTISFHNARFDPPYRSVGLLRSLSVAPDKDKVQHSGMIEGEFTWDEALAIVERMIHENETGTNNLCQIRPAVYRTIEDAFALAQRDLIAKHPEWLRKDVPPVPPEFHKYSVDIRRSDGQTIMSRVGSLELVQLIKERLAAKFSGSICDPSGNVLDEWKSGTATD